MQHRVSVARASAVAFLFAASVGVVACSGAGASDNASGDAAGGVASTSKGSSAKYSCPAPPKDVDVGTFVGDQLPSLMVKDCDGNDVSLDQYCGAAGLWLYVVHTWCPHCNKVGDYAEELATSEKAKGVVSLQIVYQNDDHAAATAADCKAWRDEKKLSNAITLYDPYGVTKPLNDSTFTSLSLYIDKGRIIRGKTHTDDETAIRTGIDGLLSTK